MISKGIVNNKNLKKHKVLKLICPSIKNLQSIYSRAGKKDPPSGLIGLNLDKIFFVHEKIKIIADKSYSSCPKGFVHRKKSQSLFFQGQKGTIYLLTNSFVRTKNVLSRTILIFAFDARQKDRA